MITLTSARIAELNRQILRQAPARAIAALEYKAAEAGIRCDVAEPPKPIVINKEIAIVAKLAKRAVKAAARRKGNPHVEA